MTCLGVVPGTAVPAQGWIADGAHPLILTPLLVGTPRSTEPLWDPPAGASLELLPNLALPSDARSNGGQRRGRSSQDARGISSSVARLSCRLVKREAAAELRPSADRHRLKPNRRLESIFTELQELDASVDSVRDTHLAFIANGERSAKDLAAWRALRHHRRIHASTTVVGAVDGCVNAQGPAGDIACPASGGLGLSDRVKVHASLCRVRSNCRTAVSMVHDAQASAQNAPVVSAALRAAEDFQHAHARKSPRPGTTHSRSQQHALARFDDIDDGVIELSSVCADISMDTQRVDTKLTYYRERCEMVLPAIEDRFMHVDPETGAHLVDVAKVRKRLHARRDAEDAQAKVSSMIDVVHTDADSGTLSTTSLSSPQTLSKVSTRCMLSAASTSIESLEQRSARLIQRGVVRDLRIADVREAERNQLRERRLAQLEELELKALRKRIATRDRTLFIWILTAIASETMVRMLRGFHIVYAKLKENTCEDTVLQSGRSGIEKHLAAHADWRDLGSRCEFVKSLLPNSKHLLVSGLQNKWKTEMQRKCRTRAKKSWYKLLRVMHFIGIMYRRRRLNGFAEIIKDIINCSWRGYRMRASIKVYLQQMNFLQNAIRACIRIRTHLRQYLYMPTVWEVETTILGEVIGMPHATLDAEINTHRQNWDLKQRLQEVRQLMDVRNAWHQDDKVCLGKRFAVAFKQRQEYKRRNAVVVGIFRSGSVTRTLASEHTKATGVATRGQRCHGQPHRLKVNLTISASGRALAAPGFGGRAPRTSHPMMDVINKYRLSKEHRNDLVATMLRNAVSRWWTRYKDYKEQLKHYQKDWEKWRLDVMALGPHNRSAWLPYPLPPRYPYELTKVDTKWLHARVLKTLKTTEAGQLL